MERKGQAAMEFLMTYGWAILAAIIVIGVLAIYFRPSSLTSNSVAVTPPFYGSGVNFAAGLQGIDLELRNNGGETVSIVSVNASLTQPSTLQCSRGPLADIPAGNTTIYELTCGSTLASGNTVQGDVAIYYTRTGSTLILQSTGTISGKVP